LLHCFFSNQNFLWFVGIASWSYHTNSISLSQYGRLDNGRVLAELPGLVEPALICAATIPPDAVNKNRLRG
jgi:hypothetical protein